MSQNTERLGQLPTSSYELIDLLDESYPHKCIGVGQHIGDAQRYAGARALIDELISLKLEEQERED